MALVISALIDIRTLALILSPLLYSFFCLLGIPFLRGAADGIRLKLEGKSGKRTPIILVFACVVTLGQAIMALALAFAG